MKRFLLIAAGFAVLGGSFAYLLKNKSSYVLLTYESHAFESSLWFFIITLVIAYLLFNVLLALVLRLYRPGKRFENWAQNRRIAASKRDFFQALLDYETGSWDKALKKFKASAGHLDRPITAYLYAARAAQQLGRKDIKEAMLHEAAQTEPKLSLTVGLVRAELLIEEKQLKEARELLMALQKTSPSNHRVQSLLDSLSGDKSFPAESA